MNDNERRKQAEDFLEYLKEKQKLDDAVEKQTGMFECPWCGEMKPISARCSKGYCIACSGYDF